MKHFLAIYIGTPDVLAKSEWNNLDEATRMERQATGMKAWGDWMVRNQPSVVFQGGPLGKTLRASVKGIEGIKNTMTGFVLVQAETHEAAARLFENHPHFTIFPGDSVEIMECLPIPGQ